MLAQKLSQVEGIGEVVVGGSSLPAVRVDLIPQALYKYGIGLEDVRAALASANAHSPKGGIDVGDQRYQIYANDQANKAADYQSLIVAYRNGARGAPFRCRRGHRRGRKPAQCRPRQRQAGRADHPVPAAGRQHHRDRRSR